MRRGFIHLHGNRCQLDRESMQVLDCGEDKKAVWLIRAFKIGLIANWFLHFIW